ncbi:hypothetical protein B9Z55_008687 [Caenorhabditis nigoni]|uniref:Uncharacterized protein n=1 Tax=Caenorhabditis nigoni TaxID=1611254 RepID=A0A2G5UNU7_9PELO|nr:hypothetical protein B9Z55_008687 [Caenorhabditis nigoni]
MLIGVEGFFLVTRLLVAQIMTYETQRNERMGLLMLAQGEHWPAKYLAGLRDAEKERERWPAIQTLADHFSRFSASHWPAK